MPAKTKVKRKYTRRTNGTPVNGTNYAYKVESGIQITTIRFSDLANKFPFSIMNVGDSFMIPATDPVSKNPNTVHYAAKQYARLKPGFIITTRMQLDKNRRVWRIK